MTKLITAAVLSVLDKVFETILYNQLSTFLENEKLLHPNQYGFRKGFGIDQAVVNVVNYIGDGLDRALNGVEDLFYDFSKAFDLVIHSVLIE